MNVHATKIEIYLSKKYLVSMSADVRANFHDLDLGMLPGHEVLQTCHSRLHSCHQQVVCSS